MADKDVPQEPSVEDSALDEFSDPSEPPQPPEPGPGEDQPTREPDARYKTAGQWEVPDKPGGNVEDKLRDGGDEQA